ncbi:MAG: ATP-binding cassette domain-containing protein [Pseudomonadota bacterium]
MISLDEVSFGYNGRETLTGVSADIAPGTFHFLTGPSGAGKTTLLKMFYLEHMPRGGEMRIFGQDPTLLDQSQLVRLRRRIGIVFQEFRLLEHISVAENIALPLRVCGLPVEAHRKDIQELIAWVGLAHRADAMPPQLSAGEKQRAAIARAVINSPDILLADEPTGNVDPEMGARILHLLVELNRHGRTVVLATHDLSLIRSARGMVQARILRLADGQLIQGGAEL